MLINVVNIGEVIFVKQTVILCNQALTINRIKDKYSCILCVIILICNNPTTLLIRAPDKREY